MEFHNVSFSYDNSNIVFQNVSFIVASGEFVIIKGSSGSGKSTLLRLCCRLEQPTAGKIFLGGSDIAELEPPELRKRVCYLQQTPTLISGTIRENLMLPFSFKSNRGKIPPSDADMEKVLAEFQLSELPLEFPALNMSAGQKQRLCLIRAIFINPDILLLDEPTSALDEKSAAIVLKKAQFINLEQGITIFMVTHSRHDINHVTPRIFAVEEEKVVIE